MGIHDISNGLGHFLSFLVVDESVEVDRGWKGDSSRHEQARPNDGVEPQDILSNNVDIAGPELLDSFLSVTVGSKVIDSGQIVGEGIDPHIHNVLVTKSFWNTDAPRKGGSTDGQVSEGIRRQSAQNVVSVLLGSDKVWVVLDVLDEPIGVGRHLEEVGFFLNPLEGKSRGRILEVIDLGLRIRHKGLLSNIVPTGIRIQVNITIGSACLPEFLSHALVTITRRSNVVVVGNQEALVEILEASHVLRLRKICCVW